MANVLPKAQGTRKLSSVGEGVPNMPPAAGAPMKSPRQNMNKGFSVDSAASLGTDHVGLKQGKVQPKVGRG